MCSAARSVPRTAQRALDKFHEQAGWAGICIVSGVDDDGRPAWHMYAFHCCDLRASLTSALSVERGMTKNGQGFLNSLLAYLARDRSQLEDAVKYFTASVFNRACSEARTKGS